MFIYILIGLLLTANALIYHRLDRRSQSASIWAWAIFLMLFSGLRAAGIDPDSGDVYARNFRETLPLSQFFQNPVQYIKHCPPPELSFCLLASFLKDHFAYPLGILMFIYALFAIPRKVLAMKSIAAQGTIAYVLLAYFANFYFLHDMTQIRVGLASVFFLIALPYAIQRRFWPYFMLILAGTIIHRSLFLFTIVYFFNPKEFKWQLWFGAIGIFFFFAIIHHDILSILTRIQIPVFSQKVADYVKLQSWIDVKGNPYNTFLMLQLLTTILCYIYRQKLAPLCPYFYLLLKINAMSITIFYAFITLVGFSFRMNELFGIVQIFLLPMLMFIFKQRWGGQLFVVGVALCMLLFNLFHLHLMEPYRLCFFG